MYSIDEKTAWKTRYLHRRVFTISCWWERGYDSLRAVDRRVEKPD